MMRHKVIFKLGLTGFNSEFSFSKTGWDIKVKERSLPNYLLIAGGRKVGFIPFLKLFVQWETQTVLSRIWTRIIASIS